MPTSPRHGRLRLFVVALVVALGLVTSTTVPAGARAPAAPPSEEACGAFRDYFETTFVLSFLITFAQGLAESEQADADTGAPGTGADDFDPEQLQNIFLLVLSPRLGKLTGLLARSAPRVLRAPFREQAAIFGRGTEILRDDLGLTDRQIEKLRNADLTVSSPDDLLSSADVSDATLERAAEEFGTAAAGLDIEGASSTPKQERAFVAFGGRCGVLPTEVDCQALLTDVEAGELVGTPVATSDANGACEYEGPDDDGLEAPRIGLEVYASTSSYEQLLENTTSEELDGVGTEASRRDGYSTFSSSSSCGATLVVRDAKAERTLVVAVCLGDEEVTDEILVDLATTVLDRVEA